MISDIDKIKEIKNKVKNELNIFQLLHLLVVQKIINFALSISSAKIKTIIILIFWESFVEANFKYTSKELK